MNRSFIVFVLSSLFITTFIFAGNEARVFVTSNDATKTTFNAVLEGFNTEKKIAADGFVYDYISIDNYNSLGETGEASLPLITKFVQIPNYKSVTVKITGSSYKTYRNYNILPYQEIPSRNKNISKDFVKDDSYYNSKIYLPEQIVNIKEIAVMSGVRIAVININPVQYNPSSNEIKVFSNITFELTYSGYSDENNSVNSSHGISSFFNPAFAKTIINFAQPDTFSAAPNMLIICADGLYGPSLTFADWKNRKGIPTVLKKKSELGFGSTPTQNDIKAYLQSEYNGANRPEYILLIGDVTGSNTIPWFTVGADKSDHPYSCLEGTDIIPDAIVARMSVQNEAELTAQVNRLIQYELNPYMGQTDWFKRAIVCYSQDGIDPINGQVARDVFINEGGFTNVDMVNYNQGSQITSYKNGGVSWIWYIGHGAPDQWQVPYWHMSNMPSLTYAQRSPSVIAINCATNDLDWGNSFGEEYMKRSVSNTPSNYFGFTENCAFYTTDTLARAMLYAYFRHGMNDMGLMINFGKITAYQYFNGNLTVQETIHEAMLLGDPTQLAWSDVPKLLDVNMSTGSNPAALIFNVKNGSNNIQKALVGVSQNGQLKASGYTGSNGDFTVPGSVLIEGVPVNVVVSGKNLKTWEGSFGITGIASNNQIPAQFSLQQNYPNPFNPSTSIAYDIAITGFTTLKIYDVLGKEVAVLLNGEVMAGRYNFEFDASALPSGVYFYRLTSGNFSEVRKMSLIK